MGGRVGCILPRGHRPVVLAPVGRHFTAPAQAADAERLAGSCLTPIDGSQSGRLCNRSGVTFWKTLVPWDLRGNSAKVAAVLLQLGMLLIMDDSKSGFTSLQANAEAPPSRQEVRCAVRFPLALPVVLSSGSAEFAALTRNVSASGVVFDVDRPLKVGLEIRFSLRMPGAVLGTPRDVLVNCLGRVVRCSMSQAQYQAAATIDEYQFAEQ